jgi:hypothetical protein
MKLAIFKSPLSWFARVLLISLALFVCFTFSPLGPSDLRADCQGAPHSAEKKMEEEKEKTQRKKENYPSQEDNASAFEECLKGLYGQIPNYPGFPPLSGLEDLASLVCRKIKEVVSSEYSDQYDQIFNSSSKPAQTFKEVSLYNPSINEEIRNALY